MASKQNVVPYQQYRRSRLDAIRSDLGISGDGASPLLLFVARMGPGKQTVVPYQQYRCSRLDAIRSDLGISSDGTSTLLFPLLHAAMAETPARARACPAINPMMLYNQNHCSLMAALCSDPDSVGAVCVHPALSPRRRAMLYGAIENDPGSSACRCLSEPWDSQHTFADPGFVSQAPWTSRQLQCRVP